MRDHMRRGARTKNLAMYPPLLIFPEGTCVNNEYTVLFHKGAFELGCWICPVAIKYDKRWLDPFWNTRSQTFSSHLAYLMTRWCMVVDVYWLEPTKRQEGESAIQFAERVKRDISQAAGLTNLNWDGYLKNFAASQSNVVQKLRRRTQDRYANYVKHRMASTKQQVNGDEVVLGNNDDDVCANTSGANSTRSATPNLGNSSGSTVILPPWLPESSVIDIQNALLSTV